MASVNIHCPRCQSAQVYRHGQKPKGVTDFAAVTATVCFSSLILIKHVRPGMKELITEMAFNGAGVRDTATDTENWY